MVSVSGWTNSGTRMCPMFLEGTRLQVVHADHTVAAPAKLVAAGRWKGLAPRWSSPCCWARPTHVHGARRSRSTPAHRARSSRSPGDSAGNAFAVLSGESLDQPLLLIERFAIGSDPFIWNGARPLPGRAAQLHDERQGTRRVRERRGRRRVRADRLAPVPGGRLDAEGAGPRDACGLLECGHGRRDGLRSDERDLGRDQRQWRCDRRIPPRQQERAGPHGLRVPQHRVEFHARAHLESAAPPRATSPRSAATAAR